MLKRAAAVLFAVCLLCGMALPAFAHEVPDLDASGTITLHLKSGDQVLDSGTLAIYRVGEIQEDDGNYSFRPTGGFASWGGTLTDIQNPETAQGLADYAKAQGIAGAQVSIEKGIAKVTIPKGQLGLYLVVQDQPSAGFEALSPFLISVPMAEDGKYRYEIDASPKVGPIRPTEETEPPKPTEPKPTDPKLPQTGQLNWPVPVLTVLGLGLFAAGWTLRFREKRSDDEA